MFFASDPEKRKVYDERGEKGVTGEDKDMTDGGEEGGGGCSGCCCGAKAYIEKFGFAAYAAMTGMISDSEGEEESEPEEVDEEEEEEEDDDEVQAVSVNGVNINPMMYAVNPMNGQPMGMNGQPMGMNGQPMNIVRPMNGQPMNVRPMYGNPRPMYGNPRPMYGNPRPMYGNPRPMTAGAMGVVRPIIVDGRVVGSYVRPVNPNAQPSNPATNNPSSAASGSPSGEKRKTRWDPDEDEVQDEVLGEAAKRFRKVEAEEGEESKKEK